MRNSIIKPRVKAYTVFKTFFAVFICLALTAGCAAAPFMSGGPEQSTVSPAVEVVEVKMPDIGEEAGIEDMIIPFYLPQKLYDGKEVLRPSLSKSGDKATISAGGAILVELYYTEDVLSFPEPGRAEITAQDGGYTLKMRLNSKTACTLKSTVISREELIKVAGSFYLETGPIPVTAAPAAGQSLEGNITAYEELKPAAKAVLEHITEEPGSPYGIVIYQQMEFEGGTLVLAGGLHDGENCPELHFVDNENIISCRTTGSDCWELNFTELSGRRIYYGLCEAPAMQVTFGYGEASESTKPHSPGVIAVKDMVKETEGFIKNVQGYILVTDRKDMPVSFEIIKEDGENVNITEDILQGTSIPPYENVEDPSIRCDSLYRYNRMTGPEDAAAFGAIGHVSLQFGENLRELEFAGCFEDTSLQDMFKSLSVYVLCSNFIYESQYLPAGGKAMLVSEKGFSPNADVRCYFSELTPETWNKFNATGTLSFSETFKEPDSGGSIELPDKKGYYFFVMCVDDPAETSGILTYAGVISLD